ncbi:hypothetical protein WISP_143561 [Willisornis vidua]|uniref:Uncharacterized protein n=1 Tax=Willisornis vidua TaxID=1566151 RepID=A0ABQ9CQN1_9PASS|nr:hypothetical protein WISP_143561 [Willisornis vidua]
MEIAPFRSLGPDIQHLAFPRSAGSLYELKDYNKVTLWPSLVQTEQPQLFQSDFIGEEFHPYGVFFDPSLYPIHAFIMLGTPELDDYSRLLKCVEEHNCLIQMTEPAREGSPLDIVFANRGEWEGSQQNCHFQRGDFGLFRNLVDSPLGGRPTGETSPGKLDILQEENLKNAEADCPHVLKDELVGKKTGLAEQRAFSGTHGGKKRVYDLWKKERVSQQDYKDAVKLCRKKIRRSKAQLELNLATNIKDN